MPTELSFFSVLFLHLSPLFPKLLPLLRWYCRLTARFSRHALSIVPNYFPTFDILRACLHRPRVLQLFKTTQISLVSTKSQYIRRKHHRRHRGKLTSSSKMFLKTSSKDSICGRRTPSGSS